MKGARAWWHHVKDWFSGRSRQRSRSAEVADEMEIAAVEVQMDRIVDETTRLLERIAPEKVQTVQDAEITAQQSLDRLARMRALQAERDALLPRLRRTD